MSFFAFFHNTKSIRGKFFKLMLPLVFTCFIIFSILTAFVSYRSMHRNQLQKIEEFINVQSRIIAIALWNLDYKLIEHNLNGMALYPWVSGIGVSEPNSDYTMHVGKNPKFANSKDYINIKRELKVIKKNRSHVIGTLTLCSRKNIIIKSLFQDMIENLILVIFLVAAIVTSAMLSNRMTVGKPLKKLLSAIRSADRKEGRIPVDWSSNDEIGQVIRAYNELLNNLDAGEQAVKKSARQYRFLVESMNEGLIIINESNCINFANTRFCEIVKSQHQKITDTKIREFIGNDGINDTFEHIAGLSNGKRISFESELLAENDSVPVIFSASPMFEGDEYKGAVCVFTDITDRKKAEKDLRLAEEKYRGIFESATEGIYQCTNEGRFIEANPAMARIFDFDTPGDLRRNIDNVWSQLFVNSKEKDNFLEILINEGSIYDYQCRMKTKNGEEIWVETSSRLVKNDKDEILFIEGVISDITQRKLCEIDLRRQATLDELTQIPNRLMFQERLKNALLYAKKEEQMIGLLYLDLDFFKKINDTIGHYAGDLILKETAARIYGNLRENDTVARIGGDEFTVILNPIEQHEDASHFAKVIIDTLHYPFEIDGKECRIGTSIGISIYPSDGQTSSELVHRADIAMFKAKSNGRNNFRFWNGKK